MIGRAYFENGSILKSIGSIFPNSRKWTCYKTGFQKVFMAFSFLKSVFHVEQSIYRMKSDQYYSIITNG